MVLRLPRIDGTPAVRTDFSDELAWSHVISAMGAQQGDFSANISPIDDSSFEGVTPGQASVMAVAAGHAICLLVDGDALTRPDHAFLVVEAATVEARAFRCVPEQTWSVENNLSLANMDFDDFVRATDATGTFRGFS